MVRWFSKKAPPSASPEDPVAPATELEEAEQLAEALRRSLNLREAGEPEPSPAPERPAAGVSTDVRCL